MPRTSVFLTAFSFLLVLLWAGAAAAALSELENVDCAKLDIKVQRGGMFDKVECKRRTKGGYGGESPQVTRAQIVAKGGGAELFLMHDHGSSNTYMERQTPRDLFENGIDYDVPGSWKKADDSNGFDIATFFGKFGTAQVPCFALARYEGHVARSSGYQNRIFGVFCDGPASTTPISAARIDEVTASIEADFF
jgi:hypothetical protein